MRVSATVFEKLTTIDDGYRRMLGWVETHVQCVVVAGSAEGGQTAEES